MKHVSSITLFREFRKHRVYKYFFSFCIIALFTYSQSLLYPIIGTAPYFLFYPAVIIAALYGDGTSAIIMACIASQYFFINNQSLEMVWPSDYIRMGIFILVTALIRKIVRNKEQEKLKAEAAVELLQQGEKNLLMEREARERFVSALTHDLKNPLTALKLSVEMIERENLSPKLKNTSAKARKNLSRIETMVNDLLDANRIKAGLKLQIVTGDCNLHQIIENTVNDMKGIHGDRFKIKTNPQVTGHWSCNGIHRIIENLCSNAIKYGDPESPVEIDSAVLKDGVLISVNNKGPVIPEADQASIFDQHFRTKSSEHIQGWGLGLSLVKGLAEAHGGSVELISTKEHGTTFSVYLPLEVGGQQDIPGRIYP